MSDLSVFGNRQLQQEIDDERAERQSAQELLDYHAEKLHELEAERDRRDNRRKRDGD